MNLLDKYILEIGKHLPRKNRQDLQAEIRSTLEDMLDDRSQQTGKPVDDALISEILVEYGAPSKVAQAYTSTRYLIGPRLYPFFELVVKIVLTVLTVVTLVGFGFNAARAGGSGPEFLSTLGTYAAQFFTGIISAFGNIVLAFAILERVLPQKAFNEKEETWTPAELNAEPDPDNVKRAEPIFAIIFTMIGLILLNIYPELVGFTTLKDGTWISLPVLSEAFFDYLPWINLLGVLNILLNLYLLVKGAWQTTTRVASMALDTAEIGLAVIMLTGPSLIALDAAKMAEILGESAGTLTRLISILPYMVLGILIVVESIEVVKMAWGMLNLPKAAKRFMPR